MSDIPQRICAFVSIDNIVRNLENMHEHLRKVRGADASDTDPVQAAPGAASDTHPGSSVPGIVAVIKADGYGDLVYQGTLDEDNVLSMKLKKFSSLKNNVSSEEGISLSMEEFLGKIPLSFHQNDDGEVYIDGSCDIVTGILKALYTCSGYKDMEE